MTDAELSSLEAAAKAATPGPWEYEEPLILRQLDETHWQGVDTDTPNNMAYIAAANPAAELSLIAELRQARKERDWLAGMLAEHCNKQDPSVYEADGYFCRAFKTKCPFPFKDCADITPEMWFRRIHDDR